MDFSQAFDRLITNEGGYVNNPADPGGETQWGISKRSYPNLNIKALSRDAAKAIYYKDFWLAGSMDKIPGPVAFQVFDAAVNHGVSTAIRMLQTAADVAADGHIGPISLSVVNTIPVSVMLIKFIATRIHFWTKLSTWATFGKGWANRAADDLLFAAKDIS